MFHVAKKDSSRQMVFGFANVSVAKDGNIIRDLHDHEIPPDVLEDAAYDFVLRFRDAGEMHDGGTTGKLVESFMVTTEKLAALGITQDIPPRWWVGFKFDRETFDKVVSGEYTMFSIEGKAEIEEVP
jgi:hypothetical protein